MYVCVRCFVQHFGANLITEVLILWSWPNVFLRLGIYKVTQKKGNFRNEYVEMLQSFVAPALNNFPQLHEVWFQQDGATSHTARQSMTAVRELFGNHVISRFDDIPWPPRSPDLSVCEFLMWGYLKNRVHTTRPRTLDELKQRIQDEFRGIPVEMLQWALGNLNGRLKECIRRGGRHLQDVIFRHW